MCSGDADWVNAFGSRKRGSASIVDYLSGLFEEGNFNAGMLVGEPESRVRVLSPEVATVSTHPAVHARWSFVVRTASRLVRSRWLLTRSGRHLNLTSQRSTGTRDGAVTGAFALC